MLNRVVKEHQAAQATLREKNDNLRREAMASIDDVSNGLVDNLNNQVAAIFQNQRQLEAETKKIAALTNVFSKQANQWMGMLDDFTRALKEIGDVENWANVIEGDMKTIAMVLDTVKKNNVEDHTATSSQQ